MAEGLPRTRRVCPRRQGTCESQGEKHSRQTEARERARIAAEVEGAPSPPPLSDASAPAERGCGRDDGGEAEG